MPFLSGPCVQFFLHLSVLKIHFRSHLLVMAQVILPFFLLSIFKTVTIACLLFCVSSTELEFGGDFVLVQEIMVNFWPLKLGSLSSNPSCHIRLPETLGKLLNPLKQRSQYYLLYRCLLRSKWVSVWKHLTHCLTHYNLVLAIFINLWLLRAYHSAWHIAGAQ